MTSHFSPQFSALERSPRGSGVACSHLHALLGVSTGYQWDVSTPSPKVKRTVSLQKLFSPCKSCPPGRHFGDCLPTGQLASGWGTPPSPRLPRSPYPSLSWEEAGASPPWGVSTALLHVNCCNLSCKGAYWHSAWGPARGLSCEMAPHSCLEGSHCSFLVLKECPWSTWRKRPAHTKYA